MKYKNTKTGAIIHSPCKIAGGDWVKLEEIEGVGEEAEIEEEEVKEVEEKTEEPKEKVTFKGVTVKDIKQELDAMGIEYNPRANKKELYNLMIGK